MSQVSTPDLGRARKLPFDVQTAKRLLIAMKHADGLEKVLCSEKSVRAFNDLDLYVLDASAVIMPDGGVLIYNSSTRDPWEKFDDLDFYEKVIDSSRMSGIGFSGWNTWVYIPENGQALSFSDTEESHPNPAMAPIKGITLILEPRGKKGRIEKLPDKEFVENLYGWLNYDRHDKSQTYSRVWDRVRLLVESVPHTAYRPSYKNPSLALPEAKPQLKRR